MREFVAHVEAIEQRVAVLWGDKDQAAPSKVIDAYRNAGRNRRNVEVHVFPGVLHGYMMRNNAAAFNEAAYRFSMGVASGLLSAVL